MNKKLKISVVIVSIALVLSVVAIPVLASTFKSSETDLGDGYLLTDTLTDTPDAADESETVVKDAAEANKPIAAAIVVGIAAAAGALAMGIAIKGAVDGTSRQPEASGKIQTMLMLGLVFIETAIIYALIVAILIIFVL